MNIGTHLNKSCLSTQLVKDRSILCFLEINKKLISSFGRESKGQNFTGFKCIVLLKML